MTRRILKTVAQYALIAAAMWLLSALAVRALDSEIDAHSAPAWAGAYEAAE